MDKCTDYSTHSTGCQCHEARRDRIEADLRAEVERLQAIVDRGFKTVDGVPMYEGMFVYALSRKEQKIAPCLVMKPYARGVDDDEESYYSASICYSTEEAAAEAAMKKEGV
jgi:hypothetical protein